ncbi:hypothetical protein [uncultured Duncaniella sp.]|uniref:hypothetical protein n=1 Tax=uncultured Duncaniella sp. TaxID=2768039 RepID=UPI0025D08CDE|nr:hypothetical protein [uncultured Duncaniella sp.]
MKCTVKILLLLSVGLSVLSCGRLSKEAKQIAGDYIIPEVSQTEPVMELKRDATCVLRAIKPGVLTYAVEGDWNVENDSLIISLDTSTVSYVGDSALIGEIPVRSARRIVEHNDFNLQLESDGVIYYYKRIK